MIMINDNERDIALPGSESDHLDSVFDALANERRRIILRILRREDAYSVSDLAQMVATIENEGEGRATSDERKTVYVALIQTHLPRMDGLGAVDYEKDRKVVRRGERYDEMNRALSTIEDGRGRWSRISDRF